MKTLLKMEMGVPRYNERPDPTKRYNTPVPLQHPSIPVPSHSTSTTTTTSVMVVDCQRLVETSTVCDTTPETLRNKVK